MSLLIIGGDGLIGASLALAASTHGIPFVVTSRRPRGEMLALDLAQLPTGWMPPQGTSVVVICGAMTSIKACESDTELSRRVNVESPAAIARAVQASGGAVVFISTNLVFGGITDAPAWDAQLSPATVYGSQKAQAEAAILAMVDRVAIVRLTKVVHPRLALFSDWRKSLSKGHPIEPFWDLIFSPVLLEDVIRCLIALVTHFEAGVFQLSGDRDVSYAQAAGWLAEESGVPSSLVRARGCHVAGIEFIPAYSRLLPRHPREFPSPCLHSETSLRVVFRKLLS